MREIEAEAIAFVVDRTIGLDTGRAAADYIHLDARNAALLTESLEVIQKTSAPILSALEGSAEKATTPEAEPELAKPAKPLSMGGRHHAVRSNTLGRPTAKGELP